ncbi:MAG TPA: exodeoxyribonuclease VII large subunit [Burkholderiales bacterium]|nr:exodeoxyribonuclease VII large subunit [Burkholderiales bacterium]
MSRARPEDAAAAAISVADLNRRAREFIEAGFPLLWVAGEISNFTRAASGHCYFSLKDATAQVRCVYFRHRSAALDWKPENGMQVEVRAVPTLYEARGEFQLTVETMRRSGAGALYAAFARLKAKLEQEGLFEPSRRRPLPAFARSVGVVTSPQAAALRDVLTTLARRMPSMRVVIYPAPVQGEGAADKIARAVRAASARAEVDVLIVCRGGGSIEDLWAFNEEVVARALADCAVPVVSGVGHETDFTIADFVADARAPTPTAAAELVSPRRDELLARLAALGSRLAREMARALGARMQHVDHLGRRLVHPGARIAGEVRQLAQLAGRLRAAATHGTRAWAWRLGAVAQRLAGARPDVGAQAAQLVQLRLDLRRAMARDLERRASGLSGLAAQLAHLNPQAVLERGYSIVQTADGRIVRAADALAAGAALRLRFARGAASARVENIEIPQE